ncbi:MAG: 3'(2'),5'-bisphosphate nucleotidase [Saprospiraceae bacterium]|nr:MAG: 3'(2'),5'-bisphosphate nucleotidase [Saprospiraceae bacterium]
MPLTELIPSLQEIVEKAGDAILKVYNSGGDFGVEKKQDDSPLTLADKASNAIICKGLEHLRSSYPIISEENKLVAWSERRLWKRCWMVDPLDGTKEFIKRNGEFTVNVALIEDGRPVLGMVYTPVAGEMFWAVKNCGAFQIKNGKCQQVHAAHFNASQEGLRIVCSRSHLTSETQTFINRYENPRLVSKGSSLKFLMLANGEAHVYPRVAPTMEWDTAAAQAILEEAGGQVLHFETRKPLRYNKESLLNPSFLALAHLTKIQRMA